MRPAEAALCLCIAFGCSPTPPVTGTSDAVTVIPIGSATSPPQGPVEVEPSGQRIPPKLPPGQDRSLSVTIDAGGITYLNGVKLSGTGELFLLSREIVQKTEANECIVHARPSVPYAEVIRVMDVLRKAGVMHIELRAAPR